MRGVRTIARANAQNLLYVFARERARARALPFTNRTANISSTIGMRMKWRLLHEGNKDGPCAAFADGCRVPQLARMRQGRFTARCNGEKCARRRGERFPTIRSRDYSFLIFFLSEKYREETFGYSGRVARARILRKMKLHFSKC